MHAITCHFLVALTESQDFEDQILTLWMLVQNFQFLIILCCAFSSASVLLLFGINDKLQKETNAALLKYIPLSHSLVFFVINLPLAIFNSDFSECREVLLCICGFLCVCVCKQVLYNLKCSLASFHKHLRKLRVLVPVMYSIRNLTRTGTSFGTKPPKFSFQLGYHTAVQIPQLAGIPLGWLLQPFHRWENKFGKITRIW